MDLRAMLKCVARHNVSDHIVYDPVALIRSSPMGGAAKNAPVTLILFQFPLQNRNLVFSILGQEVKLNDNVTVMSGVNPCTLKK